MKAAKPFIDTNVLLYLFAADLPKADRAEQVVAQGGIISVQVLNELCAVTQRKLRMTWDETDDVLTIARTLLTVKPLSIDTHRLGCSIARRYRLAVYDSMIVAAALLSDCAVLYSEDMQHGLVIEEQLRVQNPFVDIPLP